MQIALWIDTPALGDTIAAIPTLRKITEAYNNEPITVFTTKPFLFENHPLVKEALPSDADKSDYMVYRTFSPLVGKQYDQHGTKIEFRYSNMDFRQFHAVSLGFTLQQHEMEMDLYIERERELPVKDYVIIHPTHTWPTRTWDPEKWQELVNKLNDRGIPVVAVGRDSKEVGFFNTDKPVMDIDIKLGVNLLNDPDNDPAELRWMMNNRARAVVTMDSGMLHIAGTTDVNILQLGSSIDNKLRAPYRGPNVSQDYKYAYSNGGCEVFCSSNMKSNVQVHGSIQGVPPQVKCLENRPTFECHPTVDKALHDLLNLIDYKEVNIDEQIEDMKSYVSKVNNIGLEPKTVLEIGSRDANHAEALRRAFNIKEEDVYVVEPNPNQHQRIVSTYPNFNLIDKAISDKSGTVDFYQINSGDDGWDGISGLLDRPDLYNKQFTNTKKIQVESITGSSLLDSIGKDIDVCKLDVEGLTYEVLESFGDDIRKIKTFHLETEQKVVWDNQKLDSDVKELLESKGFIKVYNKTHFTKWGEQYDQIWVQSSLIKRQLDRAYVMHCNEAYIPIIENTIKTIKEFSDIPIIVYVLNSDHVIDIDGVITHRLDVDIREGETFHKHKDHENKFINRSLPSVYDVITKKADVCKHALENYADTIVYLDGDIVATHKIDDLFDYHNPKLNYPKCTTSSYSYMMLNGKGSPFAEKEGEVFDLTKTLEYDVCQLLNVDINNRNYHLNYVQTGFILAGQNTIPFIDEWIALCNRPAIKNDHNRYAPFHEETLFNVLRWKYDYREQLPFVYVNANSVEQVRDIFYTTKYDGSPYVIKPKFGSHSGRFDDIKAFHGEKRPEVIQAMVDEIKAFRDLEQSKPNDKTRVVFLAPHLSTGGMPEFLLHRIKALKDDDSLDVHVIEYNMYATTYVVQRNQIMDLVGDNFYSLGYLDLDQEIRETKLIRLLEILNPDVIHIEECPESFDSFNQMSYETQQSLYSPHRHWKIVETCHNIWFNPKEGKRFSPDAYAFVTPHHRLETFSEEPSDGQEILFPIIEQRVSESRRRKSLEIFGFDPDAEQYHLINIGLWTPGKNQAEAIDWARRLEAQKPGKFQFHFIGNQASNFAHYWEPLMQDLPANCHIHGERSDIGTFYHIADAVIFNSTHECNPLTVRQSLGWPLPVMARNLSQYHDMYTGALTEITGDSTEDVLRLERMLQEPKPERNNVYTMKRFKQEHLDLYLKTVNGPKRRSHAGNDVTITWDAGPKVTSKVGRAVNVDFQIDGKSVYKNTLQGNGHWCKPSIQYYADWKVYVDGVEYSIDPKSNQIIQFDSSSLGDTLSWVEPCVEFKNKHGMDKLYVATHKNWLFDHEYYEELGIHFIQPGTWPEDATALWRVGVYMEDVGGQVWFSSKNKRDWRKIYLGDIASDALGVNQVMKAPKLAYFGKHTQEKPYICIATASTAQAKYWNNPTGWQELINHYNNKGYDVYHISKEDTHLTGLKNAPESLEKVYQLLQGAECFYGISSGLSWFAWATDVPIVLISGFTPEICEFNDERTLRIINKSVCNSCWFDKHFDRGDWNWCPEHKGTERMFECTKEITGREVIEKAEAHVLELNKLRQESWQEQ